MTQINKQRFIKNAIIIPIALAIIITICFFVFLHFNSSNFPFNSKSDTVVLQEYSDEEITNIYTIAPSPVDYLSKSEIQEFEANTVIGEIIIDDSSIPIIYDSNSTNALSKFNLLNNDIYIGEIGSAILTCYKDISTPIRLLGDGDEITVNTFYSEYTFEVVKTDTLDSVEDVKKFGDGIGRALVIYTDASVSNGISDKYYTVALQMTNGTKIGD